MYHSLIINGKNTFDDLGLIPTSRPIINPPEPNYYYLEVPGRNGVIDLSTSLTKRITYSNRTGNIEFLVPKERSWNEVYSELLFLFQGKAVQLVLEDDPSYYYEGRIYMSSWKNNKNNSTITIEYDLSPFKYNLKNTEDGYLVSKRSFSDSSAYFYSDKYSKVLEMIITCANSDNLDIKATIDGVSYQCKPGENILPTFQIDGVASIRVFGTGSATIKYRKGQL